MTDTRGLAYAPHMWCKKDLVLINYYFLYKIISKPTKLGKSLPSNKHIARLLSYKNLTNLHNYGLITLLIFDNLFIESTDSRFPKIRINIKIGLRVFFIHAKPKFK